MYNIPYYEVISDVKVRNIEKVMPFLLLANWHGQRVASDMWLNVYYDPNSASDKYFPQTVGFYEVFLVNAKKTNSSRKGTLRLRGGSKEDLFALMQLDLGGNYNVDWLTFSPIPFDGNNHPQLPKYQEARQRLLFPYVVKTALSASFVKKQNFFYALDQIMREKLDIGDLKMEEVDFWILELQRIAVIDSKDLTPQMTLKLFEKIFNVRLFGQKGDEKDLADRMWPLPLAGP